MYYYNRYVYQLKEFSVNFASKIATGLGRVETKFINRMIYGIIKGQSAMLSEIGRALKETIALKDTIDRLGKNLEHIFDFIPKIWLNYYDTIRHKIVKGTIVNFDFSDVIKAKGKKYEDLDKVADGSDEHKVKSGYWVAEATALIDERVTSLYSVIFSTLSKGFKSINDEMFKALDQIYKAFGNITTVVGDRGFDDQKIFKYFLDKAWEFIIRVSHADRLIFYNGIKMKLEDLANTFKGKYNIKIKLKGKMYNAKCSFAKIMLPGLDKELTVVFVFYDKSVSMFITNQDVLGKHTCLKVVASYYKRWRIEEYFKYKKQQFAFEKFMVRSLKRINALNTLLSMALSCIEIITRHQTKMLKFIKIEAKSIKTTVFFEYYRVASGIKNILGHSISGIDSFFVKQDSLQLSLFENFAET